MIKRNIFSFFGFSPPIMADCLSSAIEEPIEEGSRGF
jgi:hypothetical protein